MDLEKSVILIAWEIWFHKERRTGEAINDEKRALTGKESGKRGKRMRKFHIRNREKKRRKRKKWGKRENEIKRNKN